MKKTTFLLIIILAIKILPAEPNNPAGLNLSTGIKTQLQKAELHKPQVSSYRSETLTDTVATAWIARYNGPGNGYDEAHAIVLDASGNIYLTGRSWGQGTQIDYATIKYNRRGEVQWVARYNGPGNGYDQPFDIALDASGNVYVTGWGLGSGTSDDYTTIKYNNEGEEQWVARYNGPGNGEDWAMAIAVDASGNAYVTGRSEGLDGDIDYATIKYNSDGEEKWVARYNGPGSGEDRAMALAVDASGNVYVTGRSWGSETDFDYATIKYSSDGEEQWVARYNGPGNDRDWPFALAVDESANVYVTGLSKDSVTNFDYATIKYNSDGEEQWVTRYNGPANNEDRARALAVDASGNVYVTGFSVGVESSSDCTTIKYNNEGEELWVARYNIPGNSYNIGRAIAIDDFGNVYVTGQSDGIETTSDYASVKYNSEGEEQWSVRYNNDWDYASAIAIDASGNVYVTGSSWSEVTQYDFATIKYVQYADLPDKVLLFHPQDDVIVEISQENNEVQFEWHPSQPGDIYYFLEIATDPEFSAAHSLEELTDTVYIFTNMDDNQVYYWRVRAENDLGFGEYSDVWTFTAVMESGTFVQETERPGVTLIPNPALDYFTIHSDYLITSIMIADLSGRVVLNQPVNLYQTRIDNPLKAGIYIVSINTAEGRFVRKLFIW
jgi:uncharacterized delta-60 repeat protein